MLGELAGGFFSEGVLAVSSLIAIPYMTGERGATRILGDDGFEFISRSKQKSQKPAKSQKCDRPLRNGLVLGEEKKRARLQLPGRGRVNSVSNASRYISLQFFSFSCISRRCDA